jgi:predicted O-methyltransferase YrrM
VRSRLASLAPAPGSLGRLRRELTFVLGLRGLPRAVALFQWRARRLASRCGDEFSLTSATTSRKLSALLHLARGRRHIVELGTATGWTSISLLLGDPDRTVASYDFFRQPMLDQYLKLVPAAVSRRLEFVEAPGHAGPCSSHKVDLLYIDSSHDSAETIRELEAWRPALGDGALVVFDDYDHPAFPGVRQAIDAMALSGESREGMFVHDPRRSSTPLR